VSKTPDPLDSNPAAHLRPLDADALVARLHTLSLGHPMIYMPVLDSTNSYAMDLARSGASEGTLVITDDQPAGRGRAGRVWRTMPRQQVLCSFILRPVFPPHFLVMVASLAVARTVEDVTGVRPDIKWPNDVLASGRKLCGILIETASDAHQRRFAVLGIGLNVNGTLRDDAEIAAHAATLADLSGRSHAREDVVIALAIHLSHRYHALQTGGASALHAVRNAWRERLVTLGKHVRITQSDLIAEGLAEDVDADGALLLRRADGTQLTVTWGDVS
jgi:BirA family transcriptional regulator, biotin operon repressor / biotin---[acetyl-CoA-carboxylase] ligase